MGKLTLLLEGVHVGLAIWLARNHDFPPLGHAAIEELLELVADIVGAVDEEALGEPLAE